MPIISTNWNNMIFMPVTENQDRAPPALESTGSIAPFDSFYRQWRLRALDLEGVESG
jgi:hypothetical protein